MSVVIFAFIPFIFGMLYLAMASLKIQKKEIPSFFRNSAVTRKKRMWWSSMVVAFLICCASAASLLFANMQYKAEAFSDIEVWNGRVVGKDRKHGEYTENYDCNCRTKTRRVSYTDTVRSGKTTQTVTKYRNETYTECDTCHRQWYTVKWTCATTFGEIKIANKESLSTSVYNTPDPTAYERIVIGDPASTTREYTNYLQGAEHSILAQRARTIPAEYKIPPYPTNIYNIYKLDRFFTDVQMTDTDKAAWTKMVSDLNRDVGGRKQANIIVYVTSHNLDFADAVEARWDGLNKNDIVLVIGVNGESVKWAKVMSWTKREDFKINVRDRVMALPKLDMAAVSAILTEEVATRFERRHMKDFEYLDNEVQAPMSFVAWWMGLTITAFILCFIFVQPKLWLNL